MDDTWGFSRNDRYSGEGNVSPNEANGGVLSLHIIVSRRATRNTRVVGKEIRMLMNGLG